MLLYLDHAWEKSRAEGSHEQFQRSARRGHRRRGAAHPAKDHDCLRDSLGLLPIMWSPVTEAVPT